MRAERIRAIAVAGQSHLVQRVTVHGHGCHPYGGKNFKFIYRTHLCIVLNTLTRTHLCIVLNTLTRTYIKFLQNVETNWIVKNRVTGVTRTDFKYVRDLSLCDKVWMDF